MNEVLGLATFEEPRQALFLPGPDGGRRECNEETGQLIDAELRKMRETSHTRVKKMLEAKRPVLDTWARALIEKEAVDQDAFLQLLSGAVTG